MVHLYALPCLPVPDLGLFTLILPSPRPPPDDWRRPPGAALWNDRLLPGACLVLCVHLCIHSAGSSMVANAAGTDVMAHALEHSTWDAQAEGFPQVQGQLDFRVSFKLVWGAAE